MCGDAVTIAPVRVGPFKVDLCAPHATTVHVAAVIATKFFG